MGRTRFLFTVSLHQAELYFQSDHAFGTRSDPGGETLVRSGAVAYAVQNGLRIACGVHAADVPSRINEPHAQILWCD